MLQLILGGARSGKSRFALHQGGEDAFPEKIFLATASAGDEEMSSRIERHKRERPSGWTTLEEPYHLKKALVRSASHEDSLVVVDCVTLWISNLLCGMGGKKLTAAETESEVVALLGALSSLKGNLRIVSNEVGLGLVPDNPLGRQFRDLQGLFNQNVAKAAREVFLITAGIPQKLK
ncbi:MAG TPA: bifunctional adenosylcobinamide kinase/adenosylcobinamide-phosphate guanylyltransferase [bacterium]|nr:bifunctional adenosylcobinamide kinase/adenosylcobinamide-phosphate guanylyltransferase [bacterium]